MAITIFSQEKEAFKPDKNQYKKEISENICKYSLYVSQKSAYRADAEKSNINDLYWNERRR